MVIPKNVRKHINFLVKRRWKSSLNSNKNKQMKSQLDAQAYVMDRSIDIWCWRPGQPRRLDQGDYMMEKHL